MFRFGFFLLLVRNSPTSNNEVDWFSSVLGVALVVIWLFGLVVVLNGGKNCIERKLWVLGKKLSFFFKTHIFVLAITHPN